MSPTVRHLLPNPALVLATLALAAGLAVDVAAAAAPAAPSVAPAAWQPPPPPPDDFDWIQLKSGEWLKGRMRA